MGKSLYLMNCPRDCGSSKGTFPGVLCLQGVNSVEEGVDVKPKDSWVAQRIYDHAGEGREGGSVGVGFLLSQVRIWGPCPVI